MKKLLGLLLGASLLTTGCTTATVSPTPYPDNQVDKNYPILKGMPLSQNHTPYSPALVCLSEEAADNEQFMNEYIYTLAVGAINDMTGKYDYESGGHKVTQGADSMAVSALMKSGIFRVVDRGNMGITETERMMASQKLVRDYDFVDNQRVRNVTVGEVVGSDYRIVGAITELNYNIGSAGYELDIAGVGSKARRYVSNVAVDLFLVDTKSTLVVDYVSVQKQIVGYETKHGVFRFFGQELIDIGGGQKKQEPLQLAVRSAIEDGVWNFATFLYGKPSEQCVELKSIADGLSEPVTIQQDGSGFKANVIKIKGENG